MHRWVMICLAVALLPLAAHSAHVQWAVIDGAIGPVANEIITSALAAAEADSAEALILEMDTPGGLLSTTRLICKTLLAARVPVVMYVSPSGARAGSAGVFITLAAHVAVMAPGTNIGAAHPVGIGGEASGDSSQPMAAKVTNDAAAFARTLAERHGRNADWAERAVRNSISATEYEALNERIIDFIASSRDSLLLQLDGRVVDIAGRSDTLHTAHVTVRETPIGFRLKLLRVIGDPNIVYILMLLGIYGLFFELYNPGAILPGVVGSLSLILAFYSLQLLPVNWAGVLLILLALILFILEIKVTSYGLLSIGGVIAMILGSLMLFDGAARTQGVRVGLELIISASIVTALFFAFVVGMGIRAQKRKVATGSEGMVGEVGTVAVALALQGKIRVHGEWWDAESDTAVAVGTRVRVVGVKNMVLKVEPLKESV